ncbi:MAG: hypothetical protein HQL87_08415 [Magnetococcales bacterium]|nr:hypothetical protein [Magnetococcales bacterium]
MESIVFGTAMVYWINRLLCPGKVGRPVTWCPPNPATLLDGPLAIHAPLSKVL